MLRRLLLAFLAVLAIAAPAAAQPASGNARFYKDLRVDGKIAIAGTDLCLERGAAGRLDITDCASSVAATSVRTNAVKFGTSTDTEVYRVAAGELGVRRLDGTNTGTLCAYGSTTNSSSVCLSMATGGEGYMFTPFQSFVRFIEKISSSPIGQIAGDSVSGGGSIGYVKWIQPTYFRRRVEAVTTTKSPVGSTNVGTMETQEIYTNEGDADGATVTLPGALSGDCFTFVVQAAQTLTITAAAGDTIRVGASVTAAAGSIDSNTVGDAIELCAINATEWVATSRMGTGF